MDLFLGAPVVGGPAGSTVSLISPNDLFVNTRADMGMCNKEHCEYTKSRFDKWEDCAEKRAVVDK